MASRQRALTFRLVDPDDPSRVIRGRIDVPSDSAQRAALPCVILVHGFKGFMDWGFFPLLARRIAERGMIAVRFNMSGSGIGDDDQTFTEHEAFARNTITRELEDLERVRAWLDTQCVARVDTKRVALLGHSRGGGVALLHGAQRGDYRSIVTWSSIASVDRYDELTKRAWREQGFIVVHNARTGDDHRIDLTALDDVERNAERLDLLAACRRLATPTLLVHGSDDTTVPVESVDELAAAFAHGNARTLIIPGTGHTFGVGHPLDAHAPASEHPALEAAVSASVSMLERHW